ncbi:hypothetical protein [Bordetella sp. 15P40C-2]|uniref:hypothetical protein n=1 Tax=Bordetella sp. 15P40C-2 TaxID=2572246 RepID=UPI001328BDEA|nr:hypothetical protein [Bordetella sp. 15P40C-2]
MVETTVLDSATKLTAHHRGHVVIAASHGGVYPAYLAAAAGVTAIFLNNAGVGKDAAGIAGLEYLQHCGIPAAAVDHWSARIGDGADTRDHGKLSHVNETARLRGCMIGMSVTDAATLLAQGTHAAVADAVKPEEARHELANVGHRKVIGIDSVSLLEDADADALVVTASHGALLASSGTDSVRVQVPVISFHDAGGGKDDAGYSRLPRLEARGIAAVTVSADSARIGDSRSCYDEGIISRANAPARELGARPGDSLKSFYASLQLGGHTHRS